MFAERKLHFHRQFINMFSQISHTYPIFPVGLVSTLLHTLRILRKPSLELPKIKASRIRPIITLGVEFEGTRRIIESVNRQVLPPKINGGQRMRSGRPGRNGQHIHIYRMYRPEGDLRRSISNRNCASLRNATEEIKSDTYVHASIR